MPSAIQIILADDHKLLTDTLRARLDDEPGMSVVAVANDADTAIEVAVEKKPDVVVLDIDMPGTVPFRAAKEIRDMSENTRVIFLSAFTTDRYIESALAAGATGYVSKDEPPEVVVEAIRKAASGVAYFSPRVQTRIVVGADGKVSLDGGTKSRLSSLTERELEVLRYIAKGLPKKQIAQTMSRSYSTVDKHTENLMAKLDIHDRVELARFAIREGLAEA